MDTISDFILAISENLACLQNPDGSFPAGHNGPYYDPETPVRNTGHWLLTFSKCYELTHDEKYLGKIQLMADYLYSEKARPNGYSFHHRCKKGKDMCNGLVGQAWTIEALVKASDVLNDRKYSLLASEVFLQHKFNSEFGLWHRLEIDGKVLTMDETFNHQLWFAACGSLIEDGDASRIKNQIDIFMEKLPLNLTILDNGLVHHRIESLRSRFFVANTLAQQNPNEMLAASLKLRNLKIVEKLPFIGYTKEKSVEKLMEKSIGYHCFNMYAFSLLKQRFPDYDFWKSLGFKMAVEYMLKEEYKDKLGGNKYAFPYNPPGFEVPFSLSILKDMSENELIATSQSWLDKQLDLCFNKKTGMLDRNTKDGLTLTARIYELTRMPNKILDQLSFQFE